MLAVCVVLILLHPWCFAAKPHILFIVADDLGYNDVSWHNPSMHTPSLQKLASEGVILEQSYVQPLCTPSRTAFMTGYYPFHVGRQHSVLWPQEPSGVYLNYTFLPEKLKDLGYSTHAIGKWHLGYCNSSYLPTYRGFDTFYGFYLGSEDYYKHNKWTKIPVKTVGYDFRDDVKKRTRVAKEASGTYSAYLFARRAEKIISNHTGNQPLFMYLPFQSVHAPIQVPDRFTNLYRNISNLARRRYSGMVTALDEAVGNITRALRKYGLYNNTLIVFTADNGGQVYVGGNNYPLRGNKGTLWEGGARGAAFIHGKMLKKTKSSSYQKIHAVDWLPTLVSAAGGNVNNLGCLDGVDQWATFTENKKYPRTEFVYNIDTIPALSAAIRVGNYKLILGNAGYPDGWIPPPRAQGLHLNSYQEVQIISKRAVAPAKVSLFDLRADPTEHHNLASSNPALVKKLQGRIQEYLKTAVPPDVAKETPAGNPRNFDGVYSSGWCVAK